MNDFFHLLQNVFEKPFYVLFVMDRVTNQFFSNEIKNMTVRHQKGSTKCKF